MSSDEGSSCSSDEGPESCDEDYAEVSILEFASSQSLSVRGTAVNSTDTVKFGFGMCGIEVVPGDVAARIFTALTLHNLTIVVRTSRTWRDVVTVVMRAECHAKQLISPGTALLPPACVLGVDCLRRRVVDLPCVRVASRRASDRSLAGTLIERHLMEHVQHAATEGNLPLLRCMLTLWPARGELSSTDARDKHRRTVLMQLGCTGHKACGRSELTPVIRYLVQEALCATTIRLDPHDPETTAWGLAVVERNTLATAAFEQLADEGHPALQEERAARAHQKQQMMQKRSPLGEARPWAPRNLRLLGL